MTWPLVHRNLGSWIKGKELLLAAAALFLLLVVAYSFSADMRATSGASISGDEPLYLLTAQSLVSDGYVVHVGEVPLLCPVAVDRYRFILRYGPDEPENTHVRASGGAIDGEVPQRGSVDAVEAMVRIQEGFRCLL